MYINIFSMTRVKACYTCVFAGLSSKSITPYNSTPKTPSGKTPSGLRELLEHIPLI